MSCETLPGRMPYLGLRPFDEADHRLFFGRETQVNELLEQLESSAFVAVVGSSGSGKSSLVRAGLIPAVREGLLLGADDWRVVVFKPGHQPALRLLRAIETSRGAAGPRATQLDAPATLAEKNRLAALMRSQHGLLTVLSEADTAPETRVLIVVDQFEELFAFRRIISPRDQVATRDAAAAFVRMLLGASGDVAGRVRVVVTLRSDFIGDCDAFLGLPEVVSRSQFLVPRLNRGQMMEAIERPASVRDAGFTRFTFEQGLVNRIINDAGDRYDQLPLLQHALMRAWKRSNKRQLTHDDYDQAGGIENALSRHADEAWSEIKSDVYQAIARRLFLLLCDVAPDGQMTRRRPLVREVMDVAGATLADVAAVVSRFQVDDRNFLLPPIVGPKSPGAAPFAATPPSAAASAAPEVGPVSSVPPATAVPLREDTLLDISHEALLRRWERFAKDWQEQELRDLAELRRLVELAELYARDEGSLLPARDLERIVRWQSRVTKAWAQRYVAQVQWDNALRFVEASHAHAQRRRDIRVGIGLVLVVATLVSLWQMSRARSAESHAKHEAHKAAQAAREASHAQVERYSVAFGQTSVAATSNGRSMSWELASAPRGDLAIQQQTLAKWFETRESLNRMWPNYAPALRAVGDMNPKIRQQISGHAARWFVGVVENPLANSNPYDYSATPHGAPTSATLAGYLNADDANRTAAALLTALERRASRHDAYSHYGGALGDLAVRLRPADAADAVDRLLVVIENETNAAALHDLTYALLTLLQRLNPHDAAPRAQRLLERWISLLESDSMVNTGDWPPTPNLAALTKHVAAGDVAPRVQRSINRFLDDMAKNSEWKSRLRTADKVQVLLSFAEPQDAARDAARGVGILISAAETETAGEAKQALLQEISHFAEYSSTADAQRTCERLTIAIERELDDQNRDALVRSLVRMRKGADASLATRVVRRLVDLVEGERANASRVDQLGNQLRQLVFRPMQSPPPLVPRPSVGKSTSGAALPGDTAVTHSASPPVEPIPNESTGSVFNSDAIAAVLTAAIERQARMLAADNPELRKLEPIANQRLGHLVASLRECVDQVDGRMALRILEPLTDLFDKTGDDRLRQSVAVVMGQLVKRLESAEAPAAVTLLMSALKTKNEPSTSETLTSALVQVTARHSSVGPEPAIKQLVGALGSEKEIRRLEAIGSELGTLRDRMDAGLLAGTVDELIRLMDREPDTVRLQVYFNTLYALAPRLSATAAARATERLINAIKPGQDYVRLYYLSLALMYVCSPLDSRDADMSLTDGCKLLEDSLQRTTDQQQLFWLSYALSQLVGRIKSPDVAASYARTGLDTLISIVDANERVPNATPGVTGNAAAPPSENPSANAFVDWPYVDADPLSSLTAQLQVEDALARAAPITGLYLSFAMTRPGTMKFQYLDNCLRKLIPVLPPPRRAEVIARLRDQSTRLFAEVMEGATKDVTKGATNEATDDGKRHSQFLRISFTLLGLSNDLESEEAQALQLEVATRYLQLVEQPDNIGLMSDLTASVLMTADKIGGNERTRLRVEALKRVAVAVARESDTGSIAYLTFLLTPEAMAELPSDVRQLRMFALSNLLPIGVPGPLLAGAGAVEMRTNVRSLCQPLDKTELVEVLKGPFCVDEAERLVLGVLEEKLSQEFHRPIRFDGDVGKLVESARSLGIMNLDSPARRPCIEDVIKELDALMRATRGRR